MSNVRAGTHLLTFATVLLLLPMAVSYPTPGVNGEATEAVPVVGRLFPEAMMTNDYIGYFEAQASLHKLNDTYPDIFELIPVGTSYGWTNTITGQREPNPVYTVEITNEDSPVAFDERIHLVFTCSIHGNEKGGREGCLRVVEDFAKGIGMVAEDPGLLDVLDYMVLSFTIPNTDGWTHDEPQYVANPGVGPLYTRSNANNTDLNRQWPTLGFLEQSNSHKTMSDPEIYAVANFLRDRYPNTWYAADIHGMLQPSDIQAPPVGQEPTPFQEWLANNDNGHFLLGLLPSAQLTQDELLRLTRFSELVRERTSDCPGTLGAAWCQSPSLGAWGGNFNFWGTAWETIGYEATGSTRNFFMSPYGLNAPSVTYEMSYNHITCDGVYTGCGQVMNEFHIGTVRTIVSTFIEAARTDFRVSIDTQGLRTAYVFNPLIVSTAGEDGGPRPSGGWSDENGKDDRWDVAHNVYEASPNDYLRDIARYVRDGDRPGVFDEVAASDLAASLDNYDQLLIAGSAIEQLDNESLAVVSAWTEAGGRLVVTDSALTVLADLGLVGADDVRQIFRYAGHTEVLDRSHPFAQDLLGFARQTFDPVGTGHPQGQAPVWVVDEAALPEGSAAVGAAPTAPDVNLGTVPLGDGEIAFLGALLPDPSTESYTPYGIGSYAVTYAGNQFFLNLMGFDQVFEAPPLILETGNLQRLDEQFAQDPSSNETGQAESAEGGDSPGVGLVGVIGVAAAAVVVSRRRR